MVAEVRPGDAHHRIPREFGGTDARSNLEPQCTRHHRTIEVQTKARLKALGYVPHKHALGEIEAKLRPSGGVWAGPIPDHVVQAALRASAAAPPPVPTAALDIALTRRAQAPPRVPRLRPRTPLAELARTPSRPTVKARRPALFNTTPPPKQRPPALPSVLANLLRGD
ncbi:MAG: HNH endonuclease signature motif containing protein [Solirubrobacteraceae bacterium]